MPAKADRGEGRRQRFHFQGHCYPNLPKSPAEAIEAVYTFPLPNDAAVDDMSIIIGDRIIRGRIMERQKAKETYDAAKQQGKTAALLEQQRPNVFTQFVANITPNAEIKVTISYVETLRYTDDAYEFTFPMTIGKRYMPSTVTPEEAEKLLSPSAARPGHTISMEINVEAGVPVTGVSSLSHEIDAQSLFREPVYRKAKRRRHYPESRFHPAVQNRRLADRRRGHCPS